MNRIRAFLSLMLLGSVSWSSASFAAEGGVNHHIPGGIGTIIDLAPSKPGWVIEPMYLHYEGSTSASTKMPIAGVIAADLNVNSDAILLGGIYSFEQTILGATYSVGAYLPYVWVDVEGEINPTRGASKHLRDSTSGVGDMILFPLMMAWELADWQFDAFLTVSAPTGDYEVGRLANPGLNYWSFDPTVGVAYNNEEIGFNAALHTGVLFNTKNQDTNYHSGSAFHLDGSIQQILPVGPGYLSLGAEFFYLTQISDDSSDSEFLGGFRGHTVGVGPVLGYIQPIGENTLAAELRWLPEIDVKNRFKGDYVWLKLVYQF